MQKQGSIKATGGGELKNNVRDLTKKQQSDALIVDWYHIFPPTTTLLQ